MPDDESDEQWSGETTDAEDPTVAHDDIMKRLLDYQRSLRGDEEPAEFPAADPGAEAASEPDAVASEPEVTTRIDDEPAGVVEVSAPETASPSAEDEPAQQVEVEPEPSLDFVVASEPVPASESVDPFAASRADLEARVQRLEERLERLGGKVVSLRQSFQEMAISADERLAAMKEEIDEGRSDPDED